MPVDKVVDGYKKVTKGVDGNERVEQLSCFLPWTDWIAQSSRGADPDKAPNEEMCGVEHKHHRVHPLLAGRTELGVYPLVFGGEKTGEGDE